MKIHTLILSWNGLDKLERLRKGLCNNLCEITHENGQLKTGFDYSTIYIRDNGSNDKTAEYVNNWVFRSDHPIETKCYKIGHNRDSYAVGMNYLFDQIWPKPADDDLILLLNNDIVFGDDVSLQNMLNLMKPGVGVVGARLLYPGTKLLAHVGVIFGPRYGNMPYHYRHKEESDENAMKNRYFQAVTAAVALVRVSSFKRVSGFDTGFKWAFDDIDLCLRIGQQEKIVYCGETNIYHEESASLKKNPVNKLFLNHNVNYFKSKWFGKYKLDHELYLNDSHYNEIVD